MVTYECHSMTASRLTILKEVQATARLPSHIRITAARGENRVVLSSYAEMPPVWSKALWIVAACVDGGCL